tara:strand:+ start:896 stop:1084 length:189 start_codon:yes stop_codon:yes gene_type:complete
MMQDFKEYQLEIMNRALSLLMLNYDEHDLEELMYSSLELESEIIVLQEKVETYLINEYNTQE